MTRQTPYAPDDIPSGTLIDERWLVERTLGRGTTSCVYLVKHRNGGVAAMKVASAEVEDPEAFVRQANLANRTSHPSLVRVFGDGVAVGSRPYLVMDYIDGETLHARLEREKTLPVEEALRITLAIVDVLYAVHGQGVVHRLLHSEDVLLTKDGGVFVIDFDGGRGTDSVTAQAVSLPPTSRSHPSHFPPEVANQQREYTDLRTDVWAVGALLYRMITGTPVHSGRTDEEVLASAMVLPAPRMRAVRADVPSWVSVFLERALSPHRHLRFQNASEMRHALVTQDVTSPPETDLRSRLPGPLEPWKMTEPLVLDNFEPIVLSKSDADLRESDDANSPPPESCEAWLNPSWTPPALSSNPLAPSRRRILPLVALGLAILALFAGGFVYRGRRRR